MTRKLHLAVWLSLAALLGLALPISAFRLGDKDNCDDGCLEDTEFLSVRCMTKHPGLKQMEQIEKAHNLWKQQQAAKGAPGGGGSGTPAPIHAAGAVTIPVCFHVINKGTGLANGDV